MYSADQAEALRITRFLRKVADELRGYATVDLQPPSLHNSRVVVGLYEMQADLVEWLIKQIEEGKHR